MRMEVETLQVAEYRGSDILLRRMGNIFEYIVFHKNRFYGGHNKITIPFIRRVMGRSYTAKEKQDAVRILLVQAQTTIDMILDPQKK